MAQVVAQQSRRGGTATAAKEGKAWCLSGRRCGTAGKHNYGGRTHDMWRRATPGAGATRRGEEGSGAADSWGKDERKQRRHGNKDGVQ